MIQNSTTEYIPKSSGIIHNSQNIREITQMPINIYVYTHTIQKTITQSYEEMKFWHTLQNGQILKSLY